MKQIKHYCNYRSFLTICILLFLQLQSFAQDAPKVEVNGTDVGSWIGRNWMWIAGAVLLLVILMIPKGSSRKTTSTTIRKDDGYTTKTTTVENDI